jgi:hypothetical protein
MTTWAKPLLVMYREEDMRRRNARRETARGNGANAMRFKLRADALADARAAVAELVEAAKHAREALVEAGTDPLTCGKLARALAAFKVQA